MKGVLGKRWLKKLKGDIEGFDMQVGVLDDKVHMQPVQHGLLETPQLRSYAGGPIRRTSRQPGESTVGEVLVENMKRLNINILQKPFQDESSDILKFTREFLKLAMRRPGTSIKRIENLLQAVVRNPILKQEYGANKPYTADNKGFDRHLFDTGQMFKAIRARVMRGGNVRK